MTNTHIHVVCVARLQWVVSLEDESGRRTLTLCATEHYHNVARLPLCAL